MHTVTIASELRTFNTADTLHAAGRAFMRDGQHLARIPADWSDEFAWRVAQVLSAGRRDMHEACYDDGAFDLDLYASALALSDLIE